MLGPGNGKPRAILFRQVATPNYEFRHFLRLCIRHGYSPVILEYHNDRMSCKNPYKRSLVAPIFVERVNRNGGPIFRRQQLTNVERIEQLRLSQVTVAGLRLHDFHGLLLKIALPGDSFRSIEASEILGRYPNGARDYYVDVFSALTGDLMLVEDFVTDFAEARFYADVVRPAFDSACSIIGQRPLVRRLCDNRRVVSPLWYAYPASYRAHFNALGCNL